MNEQITAREFLSAFYPDNNETINFRTFGAKGTSGIKPVTYASTLNNLEGEFPKFNNGNSGVYFVVNSGGNKDEQINRYNAFFAENDELSIDEQHQALCKAPMIDTNLDYSFRAHFCKYSIGVRFPNESCGRC